MYVLVMMLVWAFETQYVQLSLAGCNTDVLCCYSVAAIQSASLNMQNRRRHVSEVEKF